MLAKKWFRATPAFLFRELISRNKNYVINSLMLLGALLSAEENNRKLYKLRNDD